MWSSSKIQCVIDRLCQKLHCSELAEDMERVNHAREMLERLQHNEVFTNLPRASQTYSAGIQKISNIFLKMQQRLDTVQSSSGSNGENTSGESVHSVERDAQRSAEECVVETSSDSEVLPRNTWLGFFRGYEILEENQEIFLSVNKQCIEISLEDDGRSLQSYLRAGIRCFMMDLFIGTELDKQKLISKFRESELKISREFGFPVTTTLFGLLSPRLQYTGIMDAKKPIEELEKDRITLLTTKKKYTSCCTCDKIYVNARFLIEDCKRGDFILVGPSIQLKVLEVLTDELNCVVVESGTLRSRLPVRFPARCRRLQMSLEELENITFARKVGINVLVSYEPISKRYLNELCDALRLLKCDNMRLFTRLVLNKYEGEGNAELDWIAKHYDGFLVDLSVQHKTRCGCPAEAEDSAVPNILNLSTACTNFMTRAYNMKKPIVLNPCVVAEHQLYVQPCHVPHIFHYPDKFVFRRDKYNSAFSFYFLQSALTENMPAVELSKQLFCDESEWGDDTIARACVAACLESRAKAVVVCSAWPDMAIKLSHFRPTAPILQVSAVKSIGEYISLYHHVIFMHFPTGSTDSYGAYVTNAFIFCLMYLSTRSIVRGGENVLLVYGTDAGNKLCDKYLTYKFHEKYFAKHLEGILFA